MAVITNPIRIGTIDQIPAVTKLTKYKVVNESSFGECDTLIAIFIMVIN